MDLRISRSKVKSSCINQDTLSVLTALQVAKSMGITILDHLQFKMVVLLV